ncbi:MAG TPA: helix-turn-helix transcriptional regulator [Ginsengibacter sp.]
MNNPEELQKHFGEIAALLGEKSRAAMLWNLLDGKAYTATELATGADISPQSASNHLLQLVQANILVVERQGRHRYYRYFNDKVAEIIENMASLVPAEKVSLQKSDKPSGIKYARTCYDHLAGKFGVELNNSMMKKKILIVKNNIYLVSPSGKKWFTDLGIDVEDVQNLKRKFAFPCLDWSERKPHIGGALGAAFLHIMLSDDWIRKVANTREVIITGKGRKELQNRLGLFI